MEYIVYLTINTKSCINGLNMIYIGVHQTKDANIFDGYIGCGVYVLQPSTYMYPKTAFLNAVKKYGPSAFKRIVLFKFNTKEEAYLKEAELVNLDFIKQSHVYNTSLGGLLTTHYKPLYLFNLSGKLIKKWEYSIEAYEFYGYSIERFEYAIHGKYQFLNSYWSNKDTIDISEYISKPTTNITYLYNKDGKLIKEFNSSKECAEYIGIKDLSKAIKLESLVQKLYYVSYKLVDLFIPKPRLQLQSKTFFVYKDNKLIGKAFGKELLKLINLYSWNKVRDIFRYNHGWYKDFYISIDKEITEIPEKHYSNGIKIAVYTKYGEFIETLNSIKEVKLKYKIQASKIKNIQLGDRYVGDYIFKYHSKIIVNDIV